jgi:hypothetical protein
MEVHHHPNVEKKNFKEYFLEFLMIFLAVTMGFFAETIRENISEGDKAKELAKSLYQEVYTDSINIQQKLVFRNQKENAAEYFIAYVKDSNLANVPIRFYKAFTVSFLSTSQLLFEPKDAVLNQLKNSGTLRYFKSSALQNQIGLLSVVIDEVRTRNQKEYTFLENNMRPFILKYYDFRFYEDLTQQGKLSINKALNQPDSAVHVKPGIVKINQFDREEAESIASYYLLMLRGTRQNQYAEYLNISHLLMETLRKGYDLKNE